MTWNKVKFEYKVKQSFQMYKHKLLNFCYSGNKITIEVRSTDTPYLNKTKQQEMSWAVTKPFVDNGGQLLLGGAPVFITDTKASSFEQDGTETDNCESWWW